MNRTELPTARRTEALQARFAHRVASHLEALARQVPADVDERLRFAREQALERARQAARPVEVQPVGARLLALGKRGSWWLRLASALPLLLLVAGLTLIEERQSDEQIQAAADIDSALLIDDLPPGAYADPGFAAYLKVATE